jgi:uncharacterized protein (TIGR02996 family)
MHDEATFLQAMQEHPEDTALRLAFADWLEERGDQRGELLRLLDTLTQSIKVKQRKNVEFHLRRLLTTGVQPVGPFFTNSLGMKFSLIWPGTFLMGSPANEKGRADNETQHKVTLSKGFYLAIHPVTQACWPEIMGENPSHFKVQGKSKDLPVDSISWEDCQNFLRKLSEREGRLYRMPTEAEWEYACRGGTTTSYYFGQTITRKHTNFGGRQTTFVGSFPRNAWGLYDMHGNLWEWCIDWYGEYPTGETVDPQGPADGEFRVMRGGSFGPGKLLRSAWRQRLVPTARFYSVGFRPAMTLP